MNKEQFWKQFPLGSHLCREPMPSMNEMKHDMEILKKNGFNLIKLQENWMLDEPREGQFYFDRYHELIEYANKLEMGIYLGLTCEQAPNWLWKKHPSCRMEHRNGTKAAYQAQSTLPADGKPGPCYDDPGAMADQVRFIKKLVSELGRHENIVTWNTWQEICFWSEGLSGGLVCYCPNTVAFYRRWLQSIYTDVDMLNKHWNVRYESFEDIEPDRCERRQCIPQQFYFRYFMDNVHIANILSSRCKAIKEADVLDRPVFAHRSSPDCGSGSDWIYARTQDFCGTSHYPAWGSGHGWDDHRQKSRLERHPSLLFEMWDGLAYRMDYLRCASKPGTPVWAAEYQGGPVSTDFHFGRVPDANDMRRWMLTTMGAGATGISFWVTRAEIMAQETNGFSLLDSEGDTTERFAEASRIGLALKQYPDIFAQNNKPQAETAILVDEWHYQVTRSLSFASDAHGYDMRGWYKTLWGFGMPCDFVEASQLEDERMLKYKLLIVPMPLSMSDTVAKKLLTFAGNGGTVIFEGACGRLNEVGYAVRGQINPLIREALQISVKRFSLVREPDGHRRWSQYERTYGEYAEAGYLTGSGVLQKNILRANIFIETYDTKDTDSVCLYWGNQPTGIVKNAGMGKMYLIGTCLGPSATAYVEDVFFDGVKALLNVCGVSPVHSGKLLLQKRIGDNREAWIFTNPCEETVTEDVSFPAGMKVTDLLDGGVVGGRITVEPLDVRVFVSQTKENAKPFSRMS